MQAYHILVLVLLLLELGNGKSFDGFIRKDDVPDTGMPSITLETGVEFQPAIIHSEDPRLEQSFVEAQRRFLARGGGQRSKWREQFVDNGNTYYDAYAQAWRVLGFYVDCDVVQSKERRLVGDDNGRFCQTYILWAAYVDLEYLGDGFAEYQVWDRNTKQWNQEPCAFGSGRRCAKMDCHLEDSHFKLLGFFKQPDYEDWLEQLFKHQGYCVWSQDDYAVMYGSESVFVQGCSELGWYDETNKPLYYKTIPVGNGGLTISLFSDAYCNENYDGSISLDSLNGGVLVNQGGDDGGGFQSFNSLSNAIEAWNDAFDEFKICQSCVAHSIPSSMYSEWGGGNDEEDEHEREESNDKQEYPFQCKDDAGYENVNQCMKFRTKTTMQVAGFKDVMLANRQATISPLTVMGYKLGRQARHPTGPLDCVFQFVFLSMSIAIFAFGFYMMVKQSRDRQLDMAPFREPLVLTDVANHGSEPESRKQLNSC